MVGYVTELINEVAFITTGWMTLELGLTTPCTSVMSEILMELGLKAENRACV